MKRILTVGLMVILPFLAFTQTYEFYLRANVQKKYQGYNKGESIAIVGLRHDITIDPLSTNGLNESYTLQLENGREIALTTKIDKSLQFELSSIDDLWNAAILQDVIPMLILNGTQTDLRRDAELDALKYIESLKTNGLEFNDPFLLHYLYRIINKIAPSTIIDGRPGNINIIIQDSPELNAGAYPNGTIVINTGLLAELHSEDELVAILSHEIAHFVLDHSMQNINAQIARQKRAEAAAIFATILAGVAEGAAAYYSNGYYMPGAVTAATAVAATAIASEAVVDLGMDYNHKQEQEADKYAIQVLQYLGYNPNALATALSRLKDHMVNERSRAMYFSSYSHPALMQRILDTGTPTELVDKEYERMVSFAITNTAFVKYDSRRFGEACKYASQNIANNVATVDDYLLKANCLLALNGSEESDNEVLQLVNHAKQLDPSNINIFKTEILVELRRKNMQVATNLLNEYINYLKSKEIQLKEIQYPEMWLSLQNYITNEQEWAQKMIIKLTGMAV